MKKLLNISAVCLFCISCWSAGNSHFIGEWQRTGSENKLYITHDGDNFFVEDYNGYSNRKSKYKAVIEDDELKYSILGGVFDEMGAGKIGIIYDKNVDRIYHAGDEYTRIQN
jgi:hypothetical protein